ncbi:MAG: SNF2-related protein [Bacillota bacterium]
MARTVCIEVPQGWQQRLIEWANSPSAFGGQAFLLWPGLLEAFDRPEEGRLLCLDALPVRLYPHQRRAVARAVGPLAGRVLLADEVGMGKTIEAGAILKELMLRGRVRRALLLVPAALVRQWHLELARRCDIRACLHPSPGHGWDRDEVVLASLETARIEPHASAIARCRWDLVAVDEAHRLKNSHSAAFRLVARASKRALLLLTATPVHNDLDELYNLVTLLRPGHFGTPRGFRREFTEGPRTPRNVVRLRRLLSEVLVRTRRHEAGIRLPPRHVTNVVVPFDEAGQDLYQNLLKLLRAHGEPLRRGRTALLAAVLLREATSSPAGVACTLRRLADPESGEAWHALRPGLADLLPAAERLEAHHPGPKIRWLAAYLEQNAPPAGSVVAFTQFATTARSAVPYLEAAGIRAALYCGSQGARERARELARFRRECPVLISTDAGSEGQNLQFASCVVNLDLPWNPMRVEQRIGRVHRLGQTRAVFVFNLVVPGTIEEYLLSLIYEKLGMFRDVVGDLDEVVAGVSGGLEGRIRDIVLASPNDEEMRHRLAEVGGFLERQWRRWLAARQLTEAVLDGPPGGAGVAAGGAQGPEGPVEERLAGSG